MSGVVGNNAEQKSIFMSCISDRGVTRPPIQLSSLGWNVRFRILTYYSPGQVQWQGGRSSPLSVTAADGRNVVIGVAPHLASNISFTSSAVQISNAGRSHQISVYYQPAVNSGQQTGISSNSSHYPVLVPVLMLDGSQCQKQNSFLKSFPRMSEC